MNAKIKTYSALAMASAAAIPMACKKESNDPNIIDKVINKKIIAVDNSPSTFLGFDSIDLDGNGIFDVAFVSLVAKNDSSAMVYCGELNNLFAVLNESTSSYYSLPLAKGVTLDTFNFDANQFVPISVFHRKNLLTPINKGIAGQGDKYIGFVFEGTVSNYHAGWMKINLSADFKTLTIKEYAYRKDPVLSIEIGAK
jgi:hypothetical protein